MELEEQYDRIYRYCFFKVRNRETAEDITQETFLRFYESKGYRNRGQSLQYLYTIARNLCTDECRRKKAGSLEENAWEGYSGEDMEERMALRAALAQLDERDRELLLLRYVNQLPLNILGKLYGISRFALYRRISKAVRELKDRLGGEDFP